MPASHSSVRSSPSTWRIAVTKSWKDAFVGRDADPAAVLGLGQVEHRVGQLGLVDELLVVDEHAPPRRDADPAPALALEARVDAREQLGGQLGEQALLGEEADRAGALREEDVGRRAVALLARAAARGRRSRRSGRRSRCPVSLREVLEQRADEVLAAAGVDRRARRGRRRSRAARTEQAEDGRAAVVVRCLARSL